MNELTDEDSMLEKAVLENDSFDLDTKLKIIRKIEESRTRQGILIPNHPVKECSIASIYKEPDDGKIKFNTNVKQKL